MSADPLPDALASIVTRPLFAMRLEVGAVHRIGLDDAPRQVGVITGGRFEGERMRGEVLAGGADWQTILGDGTVLLDCRILLRTHDGARIEMSYRGVRAGPPEVLARLGRGEDVDPAEYYFRINPLFQTAAPAYAWLNRLVAVGGGRRRADGPAYSVFEVL